MTCNNQEKMQLFVGTEFRSFVLCRPNFSTIKKKIQLSHDNLKGRKGNTCEGFLMNS